MARGSRLVSTREEATRSVRGGRSPAPPRGSISMGKGGAETVMAPATGHLGRPSPAGAATLPSPPSPSWGTRVSLCSSVRSGDPRGRRSAVRGDAAGGTSWVPGCPRASLLLARDRGTRCSGCRDSTARDRPPSDAPPPRPPESPSSAIATPRPGERHRGPSRPPARRAASLPCAPHGSPQSHPAPRDAGSTAEGP